MTSSGSSLWIFTRKDLSNPGIPIILEKIRSKTRQRAWQICRLLAYMNKLSTPPWNASSQLSPMPASPLYPLTRQKRLKFSYKYLAKIVPKCLVKALHNGGALSAYVELTNQIVALIQNITQKVDFVTLGVDQRVEQFFAPLHEQNPRLATEKTLPAGPSGNLHCSELQVFRNHSWVSNLHQANFSRVKL